MKSGRSGLRRAGRAAALGAALIGAILVLVAVAAPTVIRGPRFGRVVERLLPATRGQIHVGGGQWTWAAAWALWRGGSAPVILEDVRVTDPEGTEVLRARRLTGELSFGQARSDVVVRHLELTDAAWRFATMKGNGNGNVGVGFLAALQPRRAAAPPGAPTRPHVAGRGSFTIEDARIDGLDVAFELADWGLVLKNVRTAGRLGYRQEGGHESVTFEVRDADARGGGRLRILGGARQVALPFSRARLDHVASATTGASTEGRAPDAISIAASRIEAGHSALSFRGSFVGVLANAGPGRSPGIELQARIDDAGDAVAAILAEKGLGAQVTVSGRGASLGMTFSGPFENILIDAEARGFTLRRGPLEVRDLGFHLIAEPALAHVRLGQLTLASPAGGKLSLDADVGPARASAALVLDELRFPAGSHLPIYLLPLAEGTLRGTVKLHVEPATGVAAFDELMLTLVRPAGASGPRVFRVSSEGGRRPSRAGGGRTLLISGARFADGALTLREMTTPFAGGLVTASGRIVLWDRERHGWMPSPLFDLSLRADRISIQELAGNSFGAGTISARIRARGSLGDLALDVALPPREGLRILGEWFELPAAMTLHLDDRGLMIQPIDLRGAQDAALSVSGRIGLDSRLDLAVTVRKYPFGKLPALKETDLPFSGRISGDVRLSGDSQEPDLSGRLSVDGTTFRDRPLGGGSLTITPGPRGSIHASGKLVDGVTIDGTLAPRPTGLAGEGVIKLDRLRLDPFLGFLLPRLPGGVTAAGVVSGTARLEMLAGTPPSVAARLSELALTLTGPSGAAPAAPNRIQLRNDGEFELFLQGGPSATMRIQQVRFAGTAGSFVLAGESRAGASSAMIRGRVNLGALAPLMTPWLDHLSGAVDLDLRATAAGTDARPVVRGRVKIATPVSFAPRAARALGKARIGAGELELDDEVLRLRAVEVGIDGAGALVLRGTIGGERGLPGTLRLRVGAHGTDIADVDLPVRGNISGLSTPTATVKDARFALRLQGEPRRRLRLSGDVEVVSARARPANPAAAVKPGAASSWLARPEIAGMQLDLRVHARSGAVIVEVPHAPDLHVNADFRIRGTPSHPEPSGNVRGATAYSSFALFLYRLFD